MKTKLIRLDLIH